MSRVQTKLRLDADFHAKLKAAAKAAGRTLNDEMERRLERSFRDDDVVAAVEARLAPRASGMAVWGTSPQAIEYAKAQLLHYWGAVRGPPHDAESRISRNGQFQRVDG